MKATRRNLRCLSLLAGLVIGAVALGAQGQTLNVTLTSKRFNPATIPVGGTSVLTILITNATGAQINGVTVTDTLPAGVTIASFYEEGGCAAGSAFAGPRVHAIVNVSAGVTCGFSYFITGSAPGVYTNSTANISGWNGNALAFAPVSLDVGTNASVPTLSQLSLVLLALGVAALACWIRFRQTRSDGDRPV